MEYPLTNYYVAIIGGGSVCRAMLETILNDPALKTKIHISGVCDINENAEGYIYAKEHGIITTKDYNDFFHILNLNLLIELTGDNNILEKLNKEKPPGIQLIDHLEALFLWNYLKIESKKNQIKSDILNDIEEPDKVISLFNRFVLEITNIIEDETNSLYHAEKEILERERELFEIIQGSTIPTFVINKGHIVTHWNRACEKMSGVPAEEIVGTDNHSVPFRSEKRPIMADLIIDEIDEKNMQKYYGENWRKSELIEGAYESEDFFPNIGEKGSWLFFTAAPIKNPEGEITGAIETLWDRTKDRRREAIRERHNQELATLSMICSTLSTSLDIEVKLKLTVEELFRSLPIDGLCIFLIEDDNKLHLRYSHGISGEKYDNLSLDDNEIFTRIMQEKEFRVFENVATDENTRNLTLFKDEEYFLEAYIPILAKDRNILGVVFIGSRKSNKFTPEEKNIFELIGDRIGVAIEGFMIYEQYKKSEKKYRLLFDNDPNPIFLIDKDSYAILDMNKRVEEAYHYTKEELLGTSFLDLSGNRDNEIINNFKNITEGQSVLFTKKRHFKKGNIPFYVNINVCNIKYDSNDVILVTSTDISKSVENETRLIQASKMSTVGTMAAGMAHELNQPLNVIQISADFLLKKIQKLEEIAPEDLRTIATEVSENVQRAAEIIRHMREFSRQSEVITSPVDINKPILDVFKVLGQQLRVHQIETILELDENIPLMLGDNNRLEQVFINLVTNAIDALDSKGEKIKDKNWRRFLKIRSFSEGKNIIATVEDNGIGIPDEYKDKIFEPFFTSKEIGRGTGLGISISYGIVKDYRGMLEVASKVGEGTVFTLTFPIYSEKKKNVQYFIN
ncbi:MAG: PAS domain S-box protein [Spirochaetes bacterium]|nr:PAS domain S-box protein [Spirochaetota bacterium]